jgi:AcrR family transcriptional regulator
VTRRRLLDAAVECVAEYGYANLTTTKISERAAVSRGAQQHHFPHKAMLVANAVVHVHEQQIAAIRANATELPHGAPRTEKLLDLLWESYTGKLFTAALEIALAAQHDSELADVVGQTQREQDRTLVALCTDILHPHVTSQLGFTDRLAYALATIRGLALLTRMETSPATIQRHWRYARRELSAILAPPPAPLR